MLRDDERLLHFPLCVHPGYRYGNLQATLDGYQQQVDHIKVDKILAAGSGGGEAPQCSRSSGGNLFHTQAVIEFSLISVRCWCVIRLLELFKAQMAACIFTGCWEDQVCLHNIVCENVLLEMPYSATAVVVLSCIHTHKLRDGLRLYWNVPNFSRPRGQRGGTLAVDRLSRVRGGTGVQCVAVRGIHIHTDLGLSGRKSKRKALVFVASHMHVHIVACSLCIGNAFHAGGEDTPCTNQRHTNSFHNLHN